MNELTEREKNIAKDCIHDSLQKIYRSDSRLITLMAYPLFAKKIINDLKASKFISLIERNIIEVIKIKNSMVN
jgi:hypothetical protein